MTHNPHNLTGSRAAEAAPKPNGEVADPVLFSLLQRLADNKYWLGRRYAEWCTSAPTLESAVAASAMAQDEIGHARSHYPLFRQFVGHDVEPEDRSDFHSLSVLDQPFASWADFVASNFLVDTALTLLLESAANSTYDDLRNRARRIIGEEEVHWLHAQGWVRRLATESKSTRESLLQALEKPWSEVLMWFGSSDAAEGRELRERGVLRDLPEELRERFRQRVGPLLEKSGSKLIQATRGLPWQRWNGERYRLDN